MTPQDLIDTEEEIRRAWEAGEIPYLTHLEGSVDGSFERWLCEFFHANVKPGDWVLASHRCHYVWQLAHEIWIKNDTASRGALYELPENEIYWILRHKLVEKVIEGKSMFLYGPRFLCSAIVAGTASIAVGLALSIQRRGGTERVFSFSGDGAEDSGHFYESVRLAHGRNLPIQFIITDNDSSCGVTKEQRGSPTDWQWPDCVVRVRYTSKWPHAGSNVRPQLKIK